MPTKSACAKRAENRARDAAREEQFFKRVMREVMREVKKLFQPLRSLLNLRSNNTNAVQSESNDEDEKPHIISIVYGDSVFHEYVGITITMVVTTIIMACFSFWADPTMQVLRPYLPLWATLLLGVYNAYSLYTNDNGKWDFRLFQKTKTYTLGNPRLWWNIVPIHMVLLMTCVTWNLAPSTDVPLLSRQTQKNFVDTANATMEALRALGHNGRFAPVNQRVKDVPTMGDLIVCPIVATLFYLAMYRTRDNDYTPKKRPAGFKPSDEGEVSAADWTTKSLNKLGTSLAAKRALHASYFFRLAVVFFVALTAIYQPHALAPFQDVKWDDMPEWFDKIGMDVKSLEVHTGTFVVRVVTYVPQDEDTGEIMKDRKITGATLYANQTRPKFQTIPDYPGTYCQHPIVVDGFIPQPAAASEKNAFCMFKGIGIEDKFPQATQQRDSQIERIWNAQKTWEPMRMRRLVQCANVFLLFLSIIDTVNMRHKPLVESYIAHRQKEGPFVGQAIGFVLSVFCVFMIFIQATGSLNPTDYTESLKQAHVTLTIAAGLVLMILMYDWRSLAEKFETKLTTNYAWLRYMLMGKFVALGTLAFSYWVGFHFYAMFVRTTYYWCTGVASLDTHAVQKTLTGWQNSLSMVLPSATTEVFMYCLTLWRT